MQDWYPDPHWQHIHPDTEPAFIPSPGHGCCDEPKEDCVCVTSADVEIWNKISALSSISESSLENLSGLDELENSAVYWNSTYQTVNNNSSYWNSALQLSDLSGITDNSSYWDSASNIVENNSANWNKAYKAIPNIDINASAISSLQKEFEKNIKIYFDSTLSGDGTSSNPYRVKYYNEYVNLINQLSAGLSPLYNSGVQNWISLNATNDKNGINPYIKSLFSAVAVKDNDQDKNLIKHGELIEWLINNKGTGGTYKAGDGIKIDDNNTISTTIQHKIINNPNSLDEVKTYSAKNIIYYSI